MPFRKKETYEDVYKWRRHGIFQECLDHFKVGHAGADRHLIAYLTNGLKSTLIQLIH